MFTTGALERYADEVASLLPVDDARLYPVSGGSEAVETALKLARAYHLARGEPSRFVVIARRSAYHGNTLGALDASGKEPLRKPYTPWLGRFLHAPAAYEYRCENPTHPDACGAWHAGELERMISQASEHSVAAFIAEPVAGATLGAAVPCEDYWPSVVEVCRRHGVLVIADEVMTGMGRTGRWFGCDHWGVRPDILTAGKGTTSGYVPFGFAAASGEVFDAVSTTGFVHGFTWSHNGLGAAAAEAVAAARARARPGRPRRDDGGATARRSHLAPTSCTSRPACRCTSRSRSKDVIHSFWAPRLNGKRDVVPGRVHNWKLEADEPGVYSGQCAEFCGTSHANMRLKVVAHDQAGYEEWLTDQQWSRRRPTAR